MYYMTEEQMMQSRINWRMNQLTDGQIAFCKREAHELFNNPYIEHEPGDSYIKWLDVVVENIYIMEMNHQAMRCAELWD